MHTEDRGGIATLKVESEGHSGELSESKNDAITDEVKTLAMPNY